MVLSSDEMCGYIFTCSKCGSHRANKIVLPFGERNFYSGYFMCDSCGTSVNHGNLINYYSDSFSRYVPPVQLSLFD